MRLHAGEGLPGSGADRHAGTMSAARGLALLSLGLALAVLAAALAGELSETLGRLLLLALAVPWLGLGARRAVASARPAGRTAHGDSRLAEVVPGRRGGAGQGRAALAGVRAPLLGALAVVAFVLAFGVDLWRFLTTPTVRVWNVFHYYLGAEYFAELGYDDLYTAALAADAEQFDYWDPIDTVRNLATYAVEPRVLGELTYTPADHFSPSRWEQFRRDVAALQVHRAPHAWVDIFRDRGYNPTPFWSAVGSALTHLLPATDLLALKALASLDLVGYALVLVLLGRGFGWSVAATVALFFVLTPVNTNRLIGGFLQYDWFAAVALGLFGVARRRPVVAAVGLGYATLARVFPLALAGAVLLPAGFGLWQQRRRWRTVWRGPRYRFARRYAVALAAVLAAGILLGATTPRGFAAWQEFGERIVRHSAAHVTGEQRVGLQHVFTAPLAGGEDADRRSTLERQRWLYRAAALALLVGFALVVGRRSEVEAALLALVVVFAVTVASRYYWALLALLPLGAAGARRPAWRGGALAVGQALLYVGFALAYLAWGERYLAYLTFNVLLATLLLGWLAAWWWRDRRVVRRALRMVQRAPLSSRPAATRRG
jgi:hypothetical protein